MENGDVTFCAAPAVKGNIPITGKTKPLVWRVDMPNKGCQIVFGYDITVTWKRDEKAKTQYEICKQIVRLAKKSARNDPIAKCLE